MAAGMALTMAPMMAERTAMVLGMGDWTGMVAGTAQRTLEPWGGP
jgi:hypothetical protein